MKMKKIILLLSAALSSSAFADNCENARNTYDDVYCTNKLYASADTELNQNYQALRGKLSASQKALLAHIDALTAQVTPEPGSLLAFIRASDDPVWPHASKLIAEGVIHRTDLSPVKLDIPAAPSGEEGAVVVGNATVSTQELPLPEWFSMDSVRHQLETAKGQLANINASVDRAADHAETARLKLKQAGSDHGKERNAISHQNHAFICIGYQRDQHTGNQCNENHVKHGYPSASQ